MRYGSATIASSTSMASSFVSKGIDLQQEWIYSIQANWNGSAVGEFKLQVSNDNVPVTQASGPSLYTNAATFVQNWADYTGSASSTSVSAGSSTFVWNVLYPGYRWVRVAYTASSGTGTCTSINYFGKGQ